MLIRDLRQLLEKSVPWEEFSLGERQTVYEVFTAIAEFDDMRIDAFFGLFRNRNQQ